LAAIGAVLMMLQIPMAFFAPWLKLDFSTVPILLAGFGLGPLWGIAVQAVKTLMHLPLSSSQGIGEIADFLVGCAMVLPASMIYRKHRVRARALVGMIVGIACMTVVGALTNYFIMIPFYNFLMGTTVVEDMAGYIVLAVLPFNLIKGVAVCAMTFLLYRYLGRFLHEART
jgi:riboflavin transporter FmnP